MNIELKNIHYSEHLSEETNAFSANLYIDGIKAGVASNQGHGGATNYLPFNDKGRELIHQAEAYCKILPPEKFKLENREYSIDMSLEHFIDNLLHQHLVQKDLQQFRRKIEKASKNAIVFGLPDKSFRVLGLKFPVDLLLAHPNGAEQLKDILSKRILPNLKQDEVVLNTNIPEKVLKESGLKETQYIKPAGDTSQEKKVQKRTGRKL